MASTKTARVHPVVLLSIVDAHERRRMEGKTILVDGVRKRDVRPQTKTIGTLMGSYERGAINITGCFAVPYGIMPNEKTGEPELQLDMNYVDEMLEHARKTRPFESPVGWYTTTHELNDLDVLTHDYFMKRVKASLRVKEQPAVVCMTVNCDNVRQKVPMDPIVYIKTSTGVPGAVEPHTTIFHRINVEVLTYRAEQVVLDVALQGLEDKHREAHLSDGVEELAAGIKEMIGWMETIGRYVDGVIEGRTPANPQLGRRLMEAMAQGNQITSKQMDKLISGSIRDHMMVAFLTQVAKTQLALYEKMVAIV